MGAPWTHVVVFDPGAQDFLASRVVEDAYFVNAEDADDALAIALSRVDCDPGVELVVFPREAAEIFVVRPAFERKAA